MILLLVAGVALAMAVFVWALCAANGEDPWWEETAQDIHDLPEVEEEP